VITNIESKDHAYLLMNREMEKAKAWGKGLAKALEK
jgi:hypothetical protein